MEETEKKREKISKKMGRKNELAGINWNKVRRTRMKLICKAENKEVRLTKKIEY